MTLIVFAVLATMVVITQQSVAAGGFKTQIERTDDGMAKVTFQPVGAAQIPIYDAAGEQIADFNWKTGFEVSVTEQALRTATTKQGIDILALLKGIGTVSAGDKVLIAAVLPEAVRKADGSELAQGSQVYFGLDRFEKNGSMAPVVAWGGKSMGPGGAANEFNDRLLTRGVKGETPPEKTSTPRVSAKSARTDEGGVHGEGTVPLSKDPEASADFEALEAQKLRFLSTPMCSMKRETSAKQTSYWGHRKAFRTKNGRMATSWHDGLDISAKAGTPILAAADGCMTVRDMRFNRYAGYGLSLVLQHGKNLSTQYSHMQNFTEELRQAARNARAGDKICVKRGEQLGWVGQTGNCTGPHLHFGVKLNGRSVNPRDYLTAQSNSDFSKSCTDVTTENARFAGLDQALAQSSPVFSGTRAAISGHTTAR